MSRSQVVRLLAAGVLAGGLATVVPEAEAVSASASALLQVSDAAGVLTPVGRVSFQQEVDSVVVRVAVRPNSILSAGFHGMHVHDVGSCAGPTFATAGGHYNPAGTSHGTHAGDLPVLLVQADGSARAVDETSAFTVSDLLAADVAVILHAGVDNNANIPAVRLTDALGTVTQQAYYFDSNGDGIPDTAGPDPLTTAKTGDSGLRAACGIVAAAAVAPEDDSTAPPTPEARPVGPLAHARARVDDATGARLGFVNFSQKVDGVHVQVKLTGLTPGIHGFHIHDIGACVGPTFASAGGHYNPAVVGHGAHAGDNPVLLARGDGAVDQRFVTNNYTVEELVAANVAVVVHANPDNYANIPLIYHYDADNNGPDAADPAGPDPSTTGKTGDSGARRLCGVVRAG